MTDIVDSAVGEVEYAIVWAPLYLIPKTLYLSRHKKVRLCYICVVFLNVIVVCSQLLLPQ
jgi:hypothetical protein